MTRPVRADYVYLWVDGIHLGIRLGEGKLCLLVMIGVRADGRRSWPPWPTATGSPPSRGPTCCATAPAGHARPGAGHRRRALGFWARCGRCSPGQDPALLVPQDRQRAHAPPKSAHPGAKKALAEIWNAEDRTTPARPSRPSPPPTAPIPQGRRQDHHQRGRPARLLRLPRRAPGAPAHHQPDRIDVLHGLPANEGHRAARAKAAALAMAYKLLEAAEGAGARSPPPNSSPSCAPGRPSSTASSSNAPRTRPPRRPRWKPPYLHPHFVTGPGWRLGIVLIWVRLVVMPRPARA